MPANDASAMSRTAKLKAARDIRRALLPFEEALDETIVRKAELLAAIVNGRRGTDSPIDTGHEAFRSAAAGLTALSAARDHMIECHRQLVATRNAEALDPSDIGCTKSCLLAEGEAETTPLQMVA